MKSIFTILLPLLSAYNISAQLTITPGAQFSITGNMQLTLQNTDLVNGGNFTSGYSMISFTGNAPAVIAGSQPVQFNQLEINKASISSSAVLLRQNISVTHRILFTSSFLALSGKNIDLGTTGHLDGERENSRIFDILGGQVLCNANLNSPAAANPANLGLFITCNQNLGNTTIKRIHYLDVNNTGTSTNILRYYDILPAANTNLNARLRFTYFDGELNGADENALVLLQSQNSIEWANLGFTSRGATANFVEKTSIPNFGRFTLSNTNIPLPVRFISVNARCEQNKILITFKTAQEQNSSHFNIEKSNDGIQWKVAGTLPAAGNSGTENTYLFTDNNPAQNNYFRIAEYGLNGNIQYSSQFQASCTSMDIFSLWPNPVQDKVFINIITATQSPVMIKVFDSKGALVKQQKATLLPGSNQLNVDMITLANGVYHLSVSWNNGQIQKTTQVLKK